MSESSLEPVRALAGRLLARMDKEESNESVRNIYGLMRDADIDSVIDKLQDEGIRRHVLSGKDEFFRRVEDWSPSMVTNAEAIEFVVKSRDIDDSELLKRMQTAMSKNAEDMQNAREILLKVTALLTYRLLALYYTVAATFEEADPEEGRELMKNMTAMFQRDILLQ